MNARRKQPPPDTAALTQQLGARFQSAEANPQEPPAPPTPTTPRRREPEPDRVRRTYYLSREVADQLAALAARVHYDSHGQIPKHQAYDEIIRAGLDRADEITARHQQ